jgi:hypothetical protein
VISTGRGGGDCGYPFQIGTSYLVYATKGEAGFSTSICSGTSPEVMIYGVLKELRSLRDGARVDDLFGTIVMGGNGADFEALTQARPLPNVSVRATSSGGSVHSTSTDQHGAYAFPTLPHDSYRIDEDLPEGISTPQYDSGQLPPIDRSLFRTYIFNRTPPTARRRLGLSRTTSHHVFGDQSLEGAVLSNVPKTSCCLFAAEHTMR